MDQLPQSIGPYEVRDRLGQGGMGVVYLGYDPMLDRPVAIKVLKVPDEETRRRFLREARLAARVHHPHIVSIYGVGEHEGQPYLAMEFIAGRTLAAIIHGEEAVPLARKVHWLSELCAGLDHAHKSGIVHRDVKPSNLLISQSTDTLRLLDFGIAHGNEAAAMTMAGMIVGTPQYMSPEQITGQTVDARSDLFSVGLVAYELLSGRQAFSSDNLYHVSRQIVSEQPPPLEQVCPDVPMALVRAISRCLQKDPAARPGDARQIERELLTIARRLDPDHTLMAVPLEATIAAPAPGNPSTALGELLRNAAAAIGQGQLTSASDLLQQLEQTAPESAEVAALRQQLQAKRHELRVAESLARAEAALVSGTVDESEEALASLAAVAPRHNDLPRLREEHHARVTARQVALLTSRARTALQQDRLDEAAALVAEALALSPDSADGLAAQHQLLERTRAQRVARLVARASLAVDQEDLGPARKAIEALARLDPGHRDIDRLRARLVLLESGGADHVEPAPVPSPAVARAADAAGKQKQSAVLTPPPMRVPVAPPVPVRPEPEQTSAARSPVLSRAFELDDPAGGVSDAFRLRDGWHDGEHVELTLPDRGASSPPSARPVVPPPPRLRRTGPAAARSTATGNRTAWIAGGVAAVLLMGAVGGYVAWPDAEPPATSTSRTTSVASPGIAPGGTPVQPGVTPASDGSSTPSPVSTPVPASSDVADAPSAPVPAPNVPSTPANASVATDPFRSVRQLTDRMQFDRALAAIDQVKGAQPAGVQSERQRVVERARQTAEAAQRAAQDMNLGDTDQFEQGSRQQLRADEHRSKGRLRSAVTAYVQARGHFLQAFTESGRTPDPTLAAAPPPATVGANTRPSSPAAVAPPTSAPAPAPPMAKATEASANIAAIPSEQIRAVLGRFAGAYVGKDIGGLRRLWPSMDGAFEAEVQDAFKDSGELVWTFLDQRIMRTSEEVVVIARVLSQTPGAEQRRRTMTFTIVPQGELLIIKSIRIQ